jgi:hypothetical protein
LNDKYSSIVFLGNNTITGGLALTGDKGAPIKISNGAVLTFADGESSFDQKVLMNDSSSQLVFTGENTMAKGLNTTGNAGKIAILNGSTLTFTGNSSLSHKVILEERAMLAIKGNAAVLDSADSLYRNANINIQNRGRLTFKGAGSMFMGSINNANGELIFDSGVSTVAVMNIKNGAELYLKNSNNAVSLTVGDLTLETGSTLHFDINFANLSAPVLISTGTLTVGKNVNLKINSLSQDDKQRNVPLIYFSGAQSKGNFDIKNFSYDKNNYNLFLGKDGNLYMLKYPTYSENPADNFARLDLSNNQSRIADIIKNDKKLMSAFSGMSASRTKRSLDSASGVFLVNVLNALSYNDDALPLYTRFELGNNLWWSTDYKFLKLKNHNNSLGSFNWHGTGLKTGLEFYKSKNMQMGAFLNFRLNGFTQAGNIAGAFSTKAGLYSKAQYNNLGADLEIGGLITQGISRREVLLDATYNPESTFHAYGASAKLGLDYMFSINRNQKVGPYLALSWQLIKNSHIKEEDGSVLDVQIPSQLIQSNEGLFGAEFRHDAKRFNLTARLFAGQNLTGRQKLDVDIAGERLSIEGDDLSKLFFGASVGAGFNISKNLIINTEAQARANSKFNDYKGGLSVTYKLPYRK